MKTYLVSYDLMNKSKNYDGLYNEIKNSSATWWHYLESVWIITSNYELNALRTKLQDALDKDDNLLVIEIDQGRADGWLPGDAWEWLRNNTTIK